MLISEHNLHRYAAFAAMLGMAGLPLYIFAPKFFVDTYGLSLTAMGAALFGMRLIDYVQDPFLGWFTNRYAEEKAKIATIASFTMVAAIIGLFTITAPVAPLIWFIGCMTVLFTSYSLLSIIFYANGVLRAEQLAGKGHVHLASWRETGSLIGICGACILPFAIAAFAFQGIDPFVGYSAVFAVLALCAVSATQKEWVTENPIKRTVTDWASLYDGVLIRLLIVALLNAAPVAVTSTLFLFFVEYRLGSENLAGLLLLLFFASAAGSISIWQKLAIHFDPKPTLESAMLLSVLTFAGAFWLQSGDVWLFGIVCVLSGMALGADMVLLPALFSRRISKRGHSGEQAFGLWSFCTKATLALAAVTALPLLEQAGFEVGSNNSDAALLRLSVLYALVPCLLKLLALAFLISTHLEDG